MAQSDFDHYSAATVKTGKTVKLALTFFSPHPRAEGRHPSIEVEMIGDANESYLNDQIARANARIQLGEDGSKLSKKKLYEQLEKNRETLIKHSIKGMTDVFKKGGVPADGTSREELAGFVRSWASDVVLKVWNFVINAENFREPVIYDDPQALAEK